MSVDAWGGGSDEDPKLRLKELAKLKKFESAAKNMNALKIGVAVILLLQGWQYWKKPSDSASQQVQRPVQG